MAYPHKWSPVSYRSSAGQGKFAGHRPTFYRCTTQPTTKSVTDTLQRVMNAAERVVIDTRKFDHGLTQILHDDLHWLDVADRVRYKLGVIMHRCSMARLHGTSSTVAHRSPAMQAGNVSGQPHNNWWWCHDTGSPLLAAEHSLCRVRQSGTLYLMTFLHSRTTCPSKRAWKHGCSLATRVHSTSVLIQLTAIKTEIAK